MLDQIKDLLESLMRILSPFLWGLIIAYLLAPTIGFNESKYLYLLLRKYPATIPAIRKNKIDPSSISRTF